MQYVIGVTGAVGAGKSTVLRWLAGQGLPVLDADRVVHALLADDPATIGSIAGRFQGVLTGEGRIDRKALGDLVFADAQALHNLEALVHPRVREVVGTWVNSRTEPIMAVEAIKLVESDMYRAYVETWLVSCAVPIRKTRLDDRGWSEDQIARRVSAAPSTGRHLAVAARVIDNGGSAQATERQLVRALIEFRLKFNVEATK